MAPPHAEDLTRRSWYGADWWRRALVMAGRRNAPAVAVSACETNDGTSAIPAAHPLHLWVEGTPGQSRDQPLGNEGPQVGRIELPSGVDDALQGLLRERHD